MPIRRSLPFLVLPVIFALWAPAPQHVPAAMTMPAEFRATTLDGVFGALLWPGLDAGRNVPSTGAAVRPTFSAAWARAGQSRVTLVPGGVVSVASDPVVPTAPAFPPPALTPPPPPPPAADPAPAAPVDAPPAPVEDPWLRRRADEAVAMIAYPWGELGYEAVFFHGRPGIRGRTLRIERRIEIYVRPGDSATRTAFDLAHEIAHAFDFTYGSAFTRGEWKRARGVQDLSWFGCNACDDLGTPAGDFAESFAAWQVPAGDYSSRIGAAPDAVQRDLLARLTNVAGTSGT